MWSDHNQFSFNGTLGIEYRNGGDGYAANSKYRDTGPVGFPNQIENASGSVSLRLFFTLMAPIAVAIWARYINIKKVTAIEPPNAYLVQARSVKSNANQIPY